MEVNGVSDKRAEKLRYSRCPLVDCACGSAASHFFCQLKPLLGSVWNFKCRRINNPNGFDVQGLRAEFCSQREDGKKNRSLLCDHDCF
jgi:hypothetical protein